MEKFIDAFDLLLGIGCNFSLRPNQFPISLSLLHTINGIMTSICNGMKNIDSDLVEMYRKEWPKKISALSSSIKKSAKIQKSDIACQSILLLEITKLEISSVSIPNPTAKSKLLVSLGRMTIGAIKTGMTLMPDANLIEGIISFASIGMELGRKKLSQSFHHKFSILFQITT